MTSGVVIWMLQLKCLYFIKCLLFHVRCVCVSTVMSSLDKTFCCCYFAGRCLSKRPINWCQGDRRNDWVKIVYFTFFSTLNIPPHKKRINLSPLNLIFPVSEHHSRTLLLSLSLISLLLHFTAKTFKLLIDCIDVIVSHDLCLIC